jgi:hypothetical protein
LAPGNLSTHDVLHQASELSIEVLRHPLLIALDRLRQLRGIAVADCFRKRLDPRVDSHLDVLLAKLFLSIAEMRLRLIGDCGARGAHLTLDGRDRLACGFADSRGDPGYGWATRGGAA